MKQRVIGAIFVIAYFGFWFFAFSGRFFTIAIAAWLCIAALELIFSSYYMYNQKTRRQRSVLLLGGQPFHLLYRNLGLLRL